MSRASGGWTYRTQDRAISTVVFQTWLPLSLGAHTGNCIKAWQASYLLEQEMMPAQVSDPLLSVHSTNFKTGVSPTKASLMLPRSWTFLSLQLVCRLLVFAFI